MPNEQICKSCAAQVKRLSAKPFYEALAPEGRVELARTLHRYGHDHAEIVIDEALIRSFGDPGKERQLPSTDDLWALCKADPRDFESQRKPVAKQPNPRCEHCSGTGWEQATALDRFGTVVEGAKRCRDGCGVPALAVA